MTAYRPYRYQLRRLLLASTIFPVFLVIIIGLVSFCAICVWIEYRTIHQHVDESQSSLHRTEKQIQTFITRHSNSFQELGLTNRHDTTVIKRELLKLIHQQPVTLHYELSGPDQFITNNYEYLNAKNMYLFSTHQLKFKNSTYILKIYMANTPRLNEIKKDSRQFALIVDQYDNVLYASDGRFTIGEKYRPQQFGFMNESIKLNHADHHLVIYKDTHKNIGDGITLLTVMTVIPVLLVIFGFISADNMAKRQTKSVETTIQKIYYTKNRHLGTYTPSRNSGELEEINNYIYDLFESDGQLIHSIEHTGRRLRDVQLREIERQFQPHFLFNTMQTIQYLVTLSPKLAQTVVQQLSQMLRYSLHTNSHAVELNEELNYIEQYTAIQNTCFDDMVKLHIKSSEGARHQTIGEMMLQPLIENAIKHGRDTESLDITIHLTLARQNLHVLVYDNGIGISSSRLQYVRQPPNNDVFDTKHLGLNRLHNKAMIQYSSHARLHIFSRRNQDTLTCYKAPLSRGNVDV